MSTAHFESIESAQEYLGLLVQVLAESQRAVEVDLQAQAPSSTERHIAVLKLIVYNLDKSNTHVQRSHRILSDLRTLRRLLHRERVQSAA